MTLDTNDIDTRAIRPESVSAWTHDADVVVVGLGGAGTSATLEAVRAGAKTIALERQTRGGGTSAVSTGAVYFGGGTRVQKDCGFEDSVEEMTKAVRMAAGAQADDEKVEAFAAGSVEHFNWMVDLGVEFKSSFVEGKTTHPFEDDCLFFSGNELCHGFREGTTPAPRGHKVARPGEAGGFLMEPMLQAAEKSGAEIINDCRVERLIQRDDGRVVGVVAVHDGRTCFIKARRGVVLAAGGFVMNERMLAEHAPSLLKCNWKAASAGDDGLGIRVGLGAGALASNMSEGLVLNAYYPPSDHCKGIMVNSQGQRFINEDTYLGRTGDAILQRCDGRAWLIVDDELYGRTQAFHKLAAVEETFADLEKALGFPEGELVHTVETYNRWAARGQDPFFHKSADYLRPLSVPPYAAVDCTIEGSIFAVFTLGGLAIRATGQVLNPDRQVIPGLYAAGRNSAGLCLEGRTYASGLSIGDATFFGRVAGRHVAALEPWE